MSSTEHTVYYVKESSKKQIKKERFTPSRDYSGHYTFIATKFDYNGVTYYPKYIFHNGEVFTGDYFNGTYYDGIVAEYVPTDNQWYNSWIVFCTDIEEEANQVETPDISSYIQYMEIWNETKGTVMSEDDRGCIKNITITQGCTGEGFATYGSTYSPSVDCNFYTCNFALQIQQKDMICVIAYMCDLIPQVLGSFVVNEKPIYTEDTVSVRAVGLMESYMRNTKVDIKALNAYHWSEISDKYIKGVNNPNPFNLGYALCESYNYFWEFLPEDFRRVTGCYLIIDDWSIIDFELRSRWAQQLMIPAIESFSSEEDENGNYTYETTYASSITWEELLSGIAVMFQSNVIEHNGIFHIKRMPGLHKENEYRVVFDGDHYKNNSSFDKEYVYPSLVTVKGNNWYFYQKQSGEMVGFGYIDGESEVMIRDYISDVSNAFPYSVTIECPWILFELLPRIPEKYEKNFNMSAFMGHTGVVDFWGVANEVILHRDNSFMYSPANVSMSGWHPFFSPGNLIPVKDYDGITRYVYAGEMTISYDGGVSTEIISPCNVNTGGASNTSSSGSSGTSSYSNGGSASSSGANMAFQLGVTIQDGVIKGSQIIDSTITGSKIADSTIANSHIIDGTIEGTKIKESTITNSLIADSTLTGAKIKDAEIGFEKVNQSFINDLTADTAYINILRAEVAKIDTLTANDAIIQNIFSDTIISNKAVLDVLQANVISADYIKGAVADVGYITADTADLRYADITLGNIDTANINKTNIGLLFNKVGLIDRATIVDGHVTGYLSSVKINADVIDTGTLSTDRLLVTGDDGIVYKINVNSSGLSMSELQDEKYKKYLNGTDIVAGSITANEIDVENLFAQDITASGSITGAKLYGTHAEIESGKIGGWNISETSIWSGNGNKRLSLGSNGTIDSSYMEVIDGELATETLRVLGIRDSYISILAGGGATTANKSITLSLEEGLQFNYGNDTYMKISAGNIETHYGAIEGDATNGFVIRPDTAGAGTVGTPGSYFKTMYSSKYMLGSKEYYDRYGMEIGTSSSGGTSGVRIGDLSGGNGSYTYITNDCVAQHAMRINGNLTVNGSANVGQEGSSVYLAGVKVSDLVVVEQVKLKQMTLKGNWNGSNLDNSVPTKYGYTAVAAMIGASMGSGVVWESCILDEYGQIDAWLKNTTGVDRTFTPIAQVIYVKDF